MSAVVDYGDVLKFSQDSNELILDVREPSEIHESGKIPSSINIPLGSIGETFQLSDDEFKAKCGISKPQKDASITVHCRLGGRSLKAQKLLTDLGYTDVKNYSGSWNDWEKHHLKH